jgi:hypothetical protein
MRSPCSGCLLLAARDALLQLLLALQRLDHVGQRIGRISRAGEVADGELVRLQLLAAGIGEDVQLAEAAGEPRQFARPGDRAQDQGAQAVEGAALLALAGMVRGHVAHLVAQHGGELVLAGEQAQQPPRHVDVASGRTGEGVDDVGVHHVEAAAVALARRLSDPGAHLGDVGGRRAFVEAAIGLDRLRVLARHGRIVRVHPLRRRRKRQRRRADPCDGHHLREPPRHLSDSG